MLPSVGVASVKDGGAERSADGCGGWSYKFHSVFEKSYFNLFGGIILCESP